MTEQAEKRSNLSHNRELSAIFRRMANCYRYLGNEQRFRAIAYDTASKTLSNMQEPVDNYRNGIKKLDELKGVGESIANKIIEYLQTGRIETFEKLKKQVPYKLLELLDISGIGPSTLRLIHEYTGAENRGDLVRELEAGRLEGIKGFGKKKIETLRQVLKISKEGDRMPLKEAERIGGYVLDALKKIPGVKTAVLCGSLRRKKETVGDIDIVMVAGHKDWKRIGNKIVRMPFVDEVKAHGLTRLSFTLKENKVQVDIRIVHEYESGAALFYFTGSKEHNIKLRRVAKQKGWKINEYGVFDLQSGKRLAGETEEQIYALFGLRFIPPEKRSGTTEFAKYGIGELVNG